MWPTATRSLRRAGYGAQETTEAFAKARESASADKARPSGWRPTTAYGSAATCEASCLNACARGSFPQRRRGNARFGRGRRCASGPGTTHRFAGEYVEAQRSSGTRARAVPTWSRRRSAFRFGHDAGVAAMVYLSMCYGPSAKSIERFRSSTACRRGSRPHMPDRSWDGKDARGLVRIDAWPPRACRTHVVELADITRERDLPMFHAFSVFLEGWAAAKAALRPRA